ncbi:XRE family transcriptional regulator [Lentzea flava]|uniref:XRE family transcriptional regulator n=1 Tax=Lentzea flava TaxID=103732 RepID=UPI00167037D9|nr:XRE family transcriptional regulator [Lentzea flava]
MAALRFSSARLRELCTQRGVTASRLAADAGCSVSSIYKWRRSRTPSADALAAVAHALDVPLEAFFAPAGAQLPSRKAA